MTSWTTITAVRCNSSMRPKRRRPSAYDLALLAGCAICALFPETSKADDQITPVAQGDPAPFAGDLYPVEISIRWALEIEGCAERAALELDHEMERHKLELQRRDALAANDAEANAHRVEVLTAELSEARAWYRSPVFVATLAATVAIGTLLLSTVLVQATGEVNR